MEPNLAAPRPGLVNRLLGSIERIGNKLPDPAMLFLLSLFIVWVLSALLAGVEFADLDPRTGEPIRVLNLLIGITLLRAGSLEEAEQWAQADPAVVAGHFDVEVEAWYVLAGRMPQQ